MLGLVNFFVLIPPSHTVQQSGGGSGVGSGDASASASASGCVTSEDIVDLSWTFWTFVDTSFTFERYSAYNVVRLCQ